MSGSLIGGVIGAVIGFFTPIGPYYGYMIGAALGGVLFPPKGPDGPRLEDLRPQSSEYGRPIPIVYGTIALGGNVIWASELVEVEGESGGKGGSESTTFSYFANFAVAICEGDEDLTLGRIYAGPEKRLIWDGARLEGEDSGAVIRFYNGAEDQLPDPLIESYEGVGNVPAYRGTAYLVVENFPVAKDGNRIPFLTIEVGKVAAEVNEAPPDLGTVNWFQLTVGTDYYYAFYSGSYYGVIIRRKSDNTLVKSFTYPGIEWGTAPYFFLDEGRHRIVRWVQNTRQFIVLDMSTGQQTLYTVTPPGGADSDLGIYFTGGVYHNGDYVFVAYGSSATDRVSMFVVDPDTLACTAAYASNSGSAGSVTIARKPSDGSNYVYCVSTTDRKVTKHQIASGGTVTAMGTAALGFTHNLVEVDPYTGDLWTGGLSGGSFYATAHTPAGAQPLDYSDASSFLQAKDVTFTPDNGVIFSGQQLIDDHFYAFDDLTYTVVLEDYAGAYPGAQFLNLMEYNDTTDQLMALRLGGNMSFGVPADPATVNYLIPGTFTPEPDTKYMGEADYNVSLLLEGEALSAIVSDLSVRAGLTTGQIDVTQLTDTVDGYAIATQTAVRDAITALMPAYFFDAVESDGKVKFVKRGGAIAVVIPDADVGCFVAGGEPPDALETTRAMENELPRTLTVKYIQEATDYSPAARSAKRLVGASGEERTMDFPVVMTDTKAQEVAEVNLHGEWVARLSYSFTLPRKYGYLEPTDIIVVYGHTMRLTKTINDDGIIKCEARHDDSNVYTPNVVVTETLPSDKTVETLPETILELM